MNREPAAVIEMDGVRIEVYPISAYSLKYNEALARASKYWEKGLETLHEELELPVEEEADGLPTVRDRFEDFCYMSSRVKIVKGKLDFDFARAVDTPFVVRSKFIAFYLSAKLDAVRAIYNAFNRLDAPDDPAFAPTPPAEAEDSGEDDSPLAED